MGILKDTYNITKVNMAGIEREMKRKNDIEEKQNLLLNISRDRVDISLNEYERLKSQVKKQEELINNYSRFFSDLGRMIKQSPDILLKGEVIKSEYERVSSTMSSRLYVVFEYKDGDLLYEDKY